MVGICKSKKLMEGNSEKNLKKNKQSKNMWDWCVVTSASTCSFSSPLKTGVIPCGHDKMGTESPAIHQDSPEAKVGILERVE